MRKSMWMIAVMGLLSLLILSIVMAFNLAEFTTTDGAARNRVSELIKRQFKADSVAVRVRLELIPSRMEITYDTRQDSKFDSSAQTEEMRKVADLAIAKYDGRDRTKFDEIHVSRSEVHGRGYFKSTYVSQFKTPNPVHGAVPAQRFGVPVPPTPSAGERPR